MKTYDILTLFPDMIHAVLGTSIIGRAQNAGILQVNAINIRDFAENKQNRVDDYPYGGGCGMVLQPGPVFRAHEEVCRRCGTRPHTIYLSPKGKVFTHARALELAQLEHVVLLAGHYEGVDQRVLDEIVDEEISVGDFVLTGGELGAMIVVDAVARLVDGVLAEPESWQQESIAGGLLEYPQYTRPEEFRGKRVPEVLLSGHHARIDAWRRQQSLLLTAKLRPDLLEKATLSKQDRKLLAQGQEEGL